MTPENIYSCTVARTDEKSMRIRRACELKKAGYNCAQAVACAFADKCGLDEEIVKNAALTFGSGNTTTEGTCGAITGAGLVLGLNKRERASARGAMTRLMTDFKKRNGATVCRDLKGIDTGQPLRPCQMCVADAAGFLYDLLEEPHPGDIQKTAAKENPAPRTSAS